MQFKILSALFVLFVATNASILSSHLKDGLKPLVAEILEEASEEVDQIFIRANNAITRVEKNQAEIDKEIVKIVIEEGKDLNAIFIGILQEFEKDVTAGGKIVLDCIISQKDKFEAAFTQSSTEIGKCVAAQSPKITTEMRTILKDFAGFKDEFKTDIDTLKKCTGDDTICFLSFGASLMDTMKKISPAMQTNMEHILDFVASITADSKGCIDNAFLGIRHSALEIFNNAVVCIKK